MAAPDRTTVYVETSVISYLTARPSRDVVALARQEITRRWWEEMRQEYQLIISPFVLAEAGAGDADAARRRLEIAEQMVLLEPEPEVESLAERILPAMGLPPRAKLDALHLSFVVVFEIDLLLTWNCAHVANAECARRLREFTLSEGLWMPIICTPDQLCDMEPQDA